MAALTGDQLTRVRQDACATQTLNVTKTQLNAAIQACEDYYENTARAGFGAAMEGAAPGLFNATQKKLIGKYWLLSKFGRE